MTNESQFIGFINHLYQELKLTLHKNQIERRTVLVLDNASIHKTISVADKIKNYGLIAFTLPPYSPELNNIENTFGTLKNKIARRNLANKNIINIVMEEVHDLK